MDDLIKNNKLFLKQMTEYVNNEFNIKKIKKYNKKYKQYYNNLNYTFINIESMKNKLDIVLKK